MAFSAVNPVYSSTVGSSQLFTCANNQIAQVHMIRLRAAAADATAIVYDNTTNSGRVVAILACKAGTADEVDHYGTFAITKGLYMVTTGAGSDVLATLE